MGVIIFRERVRARRPKKEIEALRLDVRSKTIAWICIRREAANKYHLQGVFVEDGGASGEQLAAAQCLDDTYYIGPLPVNVALPEKAFEWKGCYRPNMTPRSAPAKQKGSEPPPFDADSREPEQLKPAAARAASKRPAAKKKVAPAKKPAQAKPRPTRSARKVRT